MVVEEGAEVVEGVEVVEGAEVERAHILST